MQFDILTIFPELFDSFLHTSLIGKAIEDQKIKIRVHDIRQFTDNKHHKVDDVPFGGGAGMVMMCQPLWDAIEHVKGLEDDQAPVIFLTPHGETWKQEMVETLSDQKKYSRIIFLCGRYEGIDQRVRDHLVDREISIGDFVLMGGELPAQVCIESIVRLIPGIIGKEESHLEESFSKSLGRDTTEYPHYTRPAEYKGYKIPDVLLSGHHAEIEQWRKEQCKKKK
ncbi:MAG TPA: tRNA (guanosine(37)-N1)-methyltransferase TrmD [Candidatus Gracilibacteria bacterium]